MNQEKQPKLQENPYTKSPDAPLTATTLEELCDKQNVSVLEFKETLKYWAESPVGLLPNQLLDLESLIERLQLTDTDLKELANIARRGISFQKRSGIEDSRSAQGALDEKSASSVAWGKKRSFKELAEYLESKISLERSPRLWG